MAIGSDSAFVMRALALVGLASLGFGCTPSSSEICRAFAATGEAARCRPDDSSDSEQEVTRFDLTGPGSHGQVFVYSDSDGYDRASATYDELIEEVFAPHGQTIHVFRNPDRKVIMVLVDGASEEAQRNAERVVSSL